MAPGWLTVDSSSGRARVVLHTVIHRRPRDLAVSLGMAARLVADGMPVVVRGIGDPAPGNTV